MWRKLAVGGGVALVVVACAAGWWLTRRPFTYEARNDPELPAVSSAEPSAHAADAGAGVVVDEELELEVGAPIELPEDAPPIVRTERLARAPSFRSTDNYLLVGVDRTWGRQWGRADTLLVAVFDDDTDHVGLVSIPRDLHVDVPGHGPARINATLRIATNTDQDPVELIGRVVSDTLAMPIHHVVVADIESFERTVDQVGGVTVDVPCPIQDNFIDRREPSGRRLLDVLAGRQHMDGRTAAMYVRSRHGRSDWDRARRQQAVLLGLRRRIGDMGPTEWIPILAEALDRGVTTTMSRLELIGLGRRVSRLAPERMHGLLLGRREVSGYRTPEGRSVLLPDFDAIDRALAGLFDAPAPGLRPERAQCPPADAALR
jgi:LCP family protein required for cell wall assembly